MCGIAGIWNLDKTPVDTTAIGTVTDALKRRGPDANGVWFDNSVGLALGHRRLSIIDLSEAGKQPMSYGDGRYWITFNGEIYNYIELRNELERKGHGFKTQADTEVILAAYAEWGDAMLDRLNGMWAFAIFDASNKKLFLSRDRYGVKPLYYYVSAQRIAFASEVTAIHKLLGPDHPLNKTVLGDIGAGSFLNHGTNQTYLHNVFSLPAGFNAVVTIDSFKTYEWYNLKKQQVPKSFKDQAASFREIFIDACKIRLRSDVPIGTCLSGGLDSGSITAAINSFSGSAHSQYSHHSFCAAFPGSPIDESNAARDLAQTMGSKIDIVDITPPSPAQLEEAMTQCDGPMHSLAFYPIWVLYRFIKQHGITVTLDGQGPDEMLGGYRPIREGLQAALDMRDPLWFYDVFRTYSLQGETSQFSSKKYARNAFIAMAKQGIKKALRMRLEKTAGAQNGLSPAKKPPFKMNAFDDSLYTQFFQVPLPGILNQYDRCSMAHGVECRMPFMDYRIVEFIFSLPVQSKVGGGYTKRIVREAMKGLVPNCTRLNRLKIGFNAPIVDWFRGPLNEWMRSYIDKRSFVENDIFDGKRARNDFAKFVANPSPNWDDAWQFWPKVHITWWLEQLKARAL
jgi:asparagine synthase (glutamine-hydrolysing)